MNKYFSYILIFLTAILSSGYVPESKLEDDEIYIQWVNNLEGDFEFANEWSYPEGVYFNKFGQLSCDGICPEGIESMTDRDGKIYADSLVKFYQLLDTTHQHHSISCEAWCYEFSGTDFVTAKQIGKNQYTCFTHLNAGTHCRLILDINDNVCTPKIELRSITSPALKTYYCKGGSIKIDNDSWSAGILKATFDFEFYNSDDPESGMYWKGRILSRIENKK
ncbi:MAG TPA: hypothetical protein PK904_13565 [Bacteroidales bacterium]|nr:hypothetical protein [Bacteroidales bacterium]